MLLFIVSSCSFTVHLVVDKDKSKEKMVLPEKFTKNQKEKAFEFEKKYTFGLEEY